MDFVKDMTAIILCGGFGTRLREETEFKPKPMVEVGGMPILWHIMKIYRHAGIRNFVLCLGYKGTIIKDFFLNYNMRDADLAVHMATGDTEILDAKSQEDWRVILAETGENSQTGNRLKQVQKYIKGSTFFTTYGDGVADINIPALLAHHRQQKRLATVTAVHPSSRFGELTIKDGCVASFQEKPQINDGWINGGYMVFEKAAFKPIPSDPHITLETGVLEPLARDNQLAVYQHGGFWQSMDTFREMQLLNTMWASQDAPWKVWE